MPEDHPGSDASTEPDEWSARARSFGAQARCYDRVRPGYPDELYADVLALAPGLRVLEAGAGSGRATVALAGRGASLVAVEPDPEMAALAREHTTGLDVEVREQPFEDVDVVPGSFDLVVGAQAWHWVPAEAGAAVARRALRSGGALAVWWNRPRDLDGPVWDAVHDVYAHLAPALDRRSRLATQADRETTLDAACGFAPWRRRTYDWAATYDADDYVALIATHSDHARLPAEQRERVLAGVHAAITEVGGLVEYRYRTVLLHATVR